ncbi:Calcineurin-like phosphoesterase [Saccharopolyspora kobensis]|uniref:Calcineurin-like phosphoesterase n=1 Tax=Saccharopolyspora kobensis TaxID=146035 RepID=A0A1H6BMJ9_9PSEU|nr:metallophosphoesterase [Saccharopolyspora kobensis]SEG61914.1 Calcineurin-like phosphoesterase [Saccharopolyspora kobensis]SFE85589.1 Calcineurin-like phosphoesterase [Saccharopolyspora kobensis]
MSATLLHVSDPHLTDDPASAERLRRVLDLSAARRPDAVVVTGDISDHGEPAEYQVFAEAMRDRPPWIAIPGNHDDPATLRAELRQDRCPVIEAGQVRVIGLDVTVPGEDHGFLRKETARSAEAAAQGADQVVLAVHQPPVLIGHSYVDAIPLTNPEALSGLIQRIPRVVAVLSGHVHTPLVSSLAGVPVLGAPGVVSELGIAPNRRPLLSSDGPPGMALHRIDDDGTVTTTFHHAV